MAALS
jgi:CheY-like chemotaxis protein